MVAFLMRLFISVSRGRESERNDTRYTKLCTTSRLKSEFEMLGGGFTSCPMTCIFFRLMALGFVTLGCILALLKSSQVTFIYIALLTIQIVSEQLHNIKMGK